MKSSSKRKVTYLLSLFVLATMLMTQCTPEKKYRVLSFFFDDVPNPNATTEVITNTSDSVAQIVSTSTRPESFLHKPFADESCKSCHEGSFSNRLLQPLPELCYTCHQDFGSKYQNLHGPIASGNCIACHDQHEAKYEKLLKRENQDLCLYCHVAKDVFKNKVHEKVGKTNCITCHNPHGSDASGLLNPGTCFQCHSNFKTKYNYLHGPVASNNCGSCHGSHASGIPKLLLREAQQLCLTCHIPADVFSNKVHKKVKTKNCTDCHNPHGGEDRFILLGSIRPIKSKSTEETTIQFRNDSISNANQERDSLELKRSTQNSKEKDSLNAIINAKKSATTPVKPANTKASKAATKAKPGSTSKIIKASDPLTKDKTSDNTDTTKSGHPYVIKNKIDNDTLPGQKSLHLLKEFLDSNTINPTPYAPDLLSPSKSPEGKDTSKVEKPEQPIK